jgi:DNA-binding SARP family transcriptional activator
MPGLHLVLLGGFEARVGDGPPVALAPKKSRALLAYLAAAGPRPHPRDTLATLLWGEVPEEQSRQSLRKALWDLRHALACAKPSPLTTTNETVTLVPESVDVLEFRAHAREGGAAARRAALGLYRGDLLEGFRVDEPAFEEWLTSQRAHLRQLSMEVLERLLEHEVREGPVTAAVDVAVRLLLLNPVHEGAHRSLIRLYARQGRRDAALRQYRACADALWRELHTKPGPETERAYREVLAASAADIASGRPRILVVEDEIVTRTSLQDTLTRAGYHVVVASDGAEAMFQLSHEAFDIVLADIWMPLLDGMKLLEVVRDKRAGTPVVLLTVHDNPELEARCLAMGAADYVTKPFEEPALLARLGRAMRRARDPNAP